MEDRGGHDIVLIKGFDIDNMVGMVFSDRKKYAFYLLFLNLKVNALNY